MSETPVTVPFVSFRPMERELDADLRGAFARVLDNSWYIGGREDAAFEKAFADYCGVRHCVGCGNGLDALVLILKAMGIGPGDEVIAPSNTFIATVLAISYAGRSARAGRADARKLQHRPRPHRGRRDPDARRPSWPCTSTASAPPMDEINADRQSPRPQGHRGRRPGPRRDLQGPPRGQSGGCRRVQLLPGQEPGSAGRRGLRDDERRRAGRDASVRWATTAATTNTTMSTRARTPAWTSCRLRSWPPSCRTSTL